MLATVPQDIPLREHSHLDLHQSNQGPDSLTLEDRLCPGCKNSVVNEQGGLVVAFGQSFFHVDCFKCAKCRNQVTADTNLLLLSDGSPICANCSYSCNICQLPILDEAIMTGDDSYHAHCFNCRVCGNRIDELVFAKTSQGIYCMNCHNERMIKIRKHAQKKAERDKANGGSSSSRSREQEARNFHRDQDRTNGSHSRPGMSRSHSNLGASSRSDSSRPPDNFRSPAKPPQGPYRNDTLDPVPPSYSHNTVPKTNASSTLPQTPSRSPPVNVAPPSAEVNESTQSHSSHHYPDRVAQSNVPHKSNTLPIPPSASTEGKRRSSFDDGVRPLNVLLRQNSLNPESANVQSQGTNGSDSEGLTVSSRRDKRRSINPGISLPQFQETAPTQSTNLSPRQTSFSTQERNGSSTMYNQSQTVFTKPPSRPISRSSSVHSTQSTQLDAEANGSRSASIPTDSYDPSQDDTIVMASPPSMPTHLSDDRDGSSHADNKRGQRSSTTLSITEANGARPPKRGSSSSNLSVDRHGRPSRSPSPAYRADVPHGIESGTDTEPDSPTSQNSEPLPPVPPPKDQSARTSTRSSLTISENAFDPDASDMSSLMGDTSDDLSEQPAVERMSHSTFIAPALPPIRFSMNSKDFDDLLSSVGNIAISKPQPQASSKSADQTSSDSPPSTPPPTAAILDAYHEEDTPPRTHDGRQSIYSVKTTLAGVPEEQHDSDDHNKASKSTSELPQNGNRSLTNGSSEPVPTIVVPTTRRTDSDPEYLVQKLREDLNLAKDRGAQHIKVDVDVADSIVQHLEARKHDFNQLKHKLDGMNRESKLYVDGITVAQTEYDREFKARRDAEAEVTRLRVLLSGQAARLTTLSGDNRRQELRQQMSKDLNDNLSGLEHDLSRLKVERDLTLAEVEELFLNRSSGNPSDIGPANLGRSLTKKLENIRHQYQKELVPLNEEKEALTREISELKNVRDIFLEETTVLNKRNEELAQLNAVYSQRVDSILPPETPAKNSVDSHDSLRSQPQSQHVQSTVTLVAPPLNTSHSASSTNSSTNYDDSQENRLRAPRSEVNDMMTTPSKGNKFKWPGSKKEMVASPSSNMETSKGKAHIEHNFQQLSVLRFTRCDHCGDKMWGSQLRCNVCATSIHVRCIANVSIPCTYNQGATTVREESPVPLLPSMFGRDLIEQVDADAKGEDRQVPVIVEKCIEAVEARALEYEGIYRKTGGSGQTKAITQLFERGDYSSFDLCDSDRFNDICSITSVLKTYFRTLPVPLLTYDLHDQFMAAIAIKDPSNKQQSLIDLVDRLPNEHYYTLRMLMLHLNRVRERCESNLMNGRNLGVVFGPTLLRSRDPSAEFSDMAGKALFVEWLVENAASVFAE